MTSNFFTPIVGQTQAVELLTQAIHRQRIAPAYLFVGPNGVGRSLTARCFVEQVFCFNLAPPKQQQVRQRVQLKNHPDLLWVQPTYLHQGQRLTAAEATAAGVKRKAPPIVRIEQIREISQFLSRPPLEAPRNVVVLEQAEAMPESAANALLKTLEEPGQATIILIAPAVESLLPTIVSRCQRIPFYRLDTTQIAQVLQQTGHTEILTRSPEVLAIAQGSPGDAISGSQQLAAIPIELLQNVRQPPQSLREALELAKQIDKTLDTEAQLWLVDYLQHAYWQQYLSGTASNPISLLEKAKEFLLAYAQPRLVWEVTLIEITQSQLKRVEVN